METSNSQFDREDNWQKGKSVVKCNLHMLETEDLTDVTFLVGSEKHVVRAHRYVLASRSCVFHAMFCGSQTDKREIIIQDIEANHFKDFLRFLYTNTIDINSENVAGLLFTSRKYGVETLFKRATSFLDKSLSRDNICEILEKSHRYGEMDLKKKALDILQRSSPKVIKSSGFLDLCKSCFGVFLKSRNLELKGEKVFEAALTWTQVKCVRQNLNPNPQNIRKVLGKLVYEIRFASLSQKFLCEEVGPSGMLTAEEILKIMARKVNPQIDISPFKADLRKRA